MKDKNLLIISNIYPSLSDYGGVFVKEQVTCLKSEFNQITVISPRLYYPQFLLKAKKFRDYIGNNFQPKNYTYDNVNVFFPKCIPLPPSTNFFMGIIILMQSFVVKRLIKKENIEFDIVHSHFILPAGYFGLKLKREYDVPLVVTGHGGDVYVQPFRNKWFLSQTKNVLGKADAIITTSNKNKSILVNKIGILSNRINIIPNGFDANLFSFSNDKSIQNDLRDRLKIPRSARLILSVGNLIEVKGHKYLISAIKSVLESNENIYCIIIGRGSGRNQLKEQIRKLNIEKFVSILDGVPHEEIPLWMNACDLFVLPSLNEGNPTVMFECLGSGKPFIGTKVGGIPEIIKSEEYGLLCKPGNSEDLAEKLKIAINKNWNYNRIREYANQFTWYEVLTSTLKIYDELI